MTGAVVIVNRTCRRCASMGESECYHRAGCAYDEGFAEQMGKQRYLTLREAAELTGVQRKVIRNRVTRGEIAVRVLGSGGAAKLRVTESALAEAGLLAGDLVPAGNTSDLIQLVREQQARITALEEQRFQIAGQLGASLERTLALQNQLIELTESLQSHPQVLQASATVEKEESTTVPTPEMEASPEDGPEDANVTITEGSSPRAAVVARSVVDKLASSKSAQRGKSGILRLRTVRWRSGK